MMVAVEKLRASSEIITNKWSIGPVT